MDARVSYALDGLRYTGYMRNGVCSIHINFKEHNQKLWYKEMNRKFGNKVVEEGCFGYVTGDSIRRKKSLQTRG